MSTTYPPGAAETNATARGFLDKSQTVAPHDYNRFLVPPAALAVHLSIGQVYAFSTFNLPLTRLLGMTQSTSADWTLEQIGWTFSIAILFLGASAAVFGRWVETVGPRKAMLVAAACFGGGFLLGAVGIYLHQLWILFLGYGVLGGCGLGIGYISPVSTLIKWFPDRPGMATGMAIMGFGGGAMIAAPLSIFLMSHFKSASSNGVFEAFAAMGVIYFLFMSFGAYVVRIPPADWKPAGWTPSLLSKKLVTGAQVHVNTASTTPQFWLLWGILCMNVTAGIGVLGQASPMIQEVFTGRVTPVAAASFVGLLSLFNMGGRFFWASVSDYIGRRNTYFVFFLLGIGLYASVPTLGHLGTIPWFVIAFGINLSMYGGGFATIPAYLRDLFGTMHVGAIHGRLLTAWSTAGVLGPVLVNYIRKFQIDSGVPKAQAYSVTMYIMCGLLVIGLLCNLAVKPVDAQHHHPGTS